MNYVYPLLVAAGGALGALCRYMTTLALAGWAGTAFPYGTLAVNGAGSFLIGLLGVLLSRVYPLPGAAAFLITGFLGGLTTFSTFSAEVTALLQQQRLFMAVGAIGLHVFGSLLMTLLGMATFSLLKNLHI